MNNLEENNTITTLTTKVTFLKKIEIATRNQKNYRNIWWVILGLSILIIFLIGLTLGLIYNEPNKVVNRVDAFQSYLTASKVLAFISLSVIILPYLYLSGSWIAGINNTSKGSIYQVFLWTCYILALFLVLIAFILYWVMWIGL